MSKFKFYTPFELIKAKDNSGNTVMKLGGIASTIDEDADGEYLDPDGFDVNDFLKVGFVNWHHQAKNKPKTIVGEPSKAEIRKDGFYVETTLYPSSDTANEIYELAQILEKDSKTRRLGYSIEGDVVERGSDDKTHPDYKKIKKAVITGLAITHMPKNPKTFAQIIKGHVEEDEEDNEDDIEKTLTTENSGGIAKESLNKELKVQVNKGFSIVELSDEKMYDKIFDTFTDINIEKAEKVFKLISKVRSDMKQNVNEDKLNKAMDALGLSVDENNPFLIKGKSSEDDENDGEGKKYQKIADKIQKENYDDESNKDDDSESDEDDSKEVKKSKDADEILKSLEGNKGLYLLIDKKIEKAISQSSKENSALGVLTSSLLEENSLLKGHIENQSSMLERQFEVINEQNELIKGIVEKMESFGSTPAPRKSIVKGFSEKESFSKGVENTNGNVLSISQNKHQILEILDQKTFAKGFDEEMSKATTGFESSNTLPSNVIQRLRLEDNITITQ
jgi:hypothetical protein